MSILTVNIDHIRPLKKNALAAELAVEGAAD